MTPAAETLERLRQKFPNLEPWWKETYGHDFDGLTESEARFLLRYGSADTIRNKLAQAAQARDAGAPSEPPSGGEGPGGGAPGEGSGGGVEPPAAAPQAQFRIRNEPADQLEISPDVRQRAVDFLNGKSGRSRPTRNPFDRFAIEASGG